MNDESKMTFLEHLEELRRRLIIMIVSILLGMVICWTFRDSILSFLLSPLYEAWRSVDGLDEPHPLNFTSMIEPFVAYLKLSAIGGVFLSAPVILYQLWKFISPGLYKKEKRLIVPFVLVSTLLFVGGSVMAYTTVFPIGFKFFLEFAAGQEMTEKTVELFFHDSISGTDDVSKSVLSKEVVTIENNEPDASVDEEYSDAKKDTDTETNDALDRHDLKTEPTSHWFTAFLSKIFTDDCGILEIKQTEQMQAELSIQWHRARCGSLPMNIQIRRNEDILYPEWKKAFSDAINVEIYIAEDLPPSAGTYTYSLKVPKNPNAHRLAPILTVKDYLSFAIRLLIAFGLVFELPILISFLAFAGIVNYRQLIHFFRYFIVLAFVIGAVLTPPDVITQILLATPLIFLYAVSIIVAYFFGEQES